MPDLRNTGVFADTSSGGGLNRGTYLAATKVKVPGTPIDVLSRIAVHTVFDDFNTGDLAILYEAVDIGTMTLNPSVIFDTGPGGVMRLASDATDGDGNVVSRTATNALSSGVLPAAGRVITFEASVTSASWDLHHWWVGLMEDPGGGDIIDANGDVLGSLEFVGFHHNDDDDTDGVPRLLIAGANNTETLVSPTDRAGVTQTITAGTDATYRRLGIRIEGTDAVEFYIDGELVGRTVIASAYTATMYITFGSVINAAANINFDIDWVYTSATR